MTKKATPKQPEPMFIRQFSIPYWLTPELSSVGHCRTYTVNDGGKIERDDDDLAVTIELNDGTHVILPPNSVILYERECITIEYPFNM